MKYYASYSGGKDSTAMLIMIKKEGLPLDEIIYCDVGRWMWPEVKEHNKQVSEYMDLPITVLDIESQVLDGFEKWGFPTWFSRYCTSLKRDTINKYLPNREPLTQYIGFAKDEEKRSQKMSKYKGTLKYPLIDYNMTEAQALELCYQEGFTFGGLYNFRKRMNCWACPLQTLDELRYLFHHYPDLWEELRAMQWKSRQAFRKGDESLFIIEDKFWNEIHDRKKIKRRKK